MLSRVVRSVGSYRRNSFRQLRCCHLFLHYLILEFIVASGVGSQQTGSSTDPTLTYGKTVPGIVLCEIAAVQPSNLRRDPLFGPVKAKPRATPSFAEVLEADRVIMTPNAGRRARSNAADGQVSVRLGWTGTPPGGGRVRGNRSRCRPRVRGNRSRGRLHVPAMIILTARGRTGIRQHSSRV